MYVCMCVCMYVNKKNLEAVRERKNIKVTVINSKAARSEKHDISV